MNDLNLEATIVFQKNFEALKGSKRFIVNQGSSRSSKTISICQLIILYCLTNPGKEVSVVRKAMTDNRKSVMKDFINTLKNMNLYDQTQHNKSEFQYKFSNDSVVEFFGIEDEQKIRGRERDLCWVNEANELLYDDFNQLNLRTKGKFIFDYNPSDASSWLYDLDPEESIMIKSTYKDNPFLEPEIVKQIENLKKTDEALWSIFGLGERSMSRKNVYGNWEFLTSRPDNMTDNVMGLDFGFNHPTSLVRVWYNETQLYIEKVIYERYLTTTALIELMDKLGIEKNNEIMADHSRPEIIQELKEAGYYVMNANKAVKKGIDIVKTFEVFSQEDADIRKEYANYMWKKQGDLILDEPVKLYDDIMDAVRYATYEIRLNRLGGGMTALFFG